ncbi:hypothetical protein L1887_62853 [Cichorium endivia]|nr:hypothetical protein L1887_62853 [Cichorium endivia]
MAGSVLSVAGNPPPAPPQLEWSSVARSHMGSALFPSRSAAAKATFKTSRHTQGILSSRLHRRLGSAPLDGVPTRAEAWVHPFSFSSKRPSRLSAVTPVKQDFRPAAPLDVGGNLVLAAAEDTAVIAGLVGFASTRTPTDPCPG